MDKGPVQCPTYDKLKPVMVLVTQLQEKIEGLLGKKPLERVVSWKIIFSTAFINAVEEGRTDNEAFAAGVSAVKELIEANHF